MATVYLAEDLKHRRKVAIKVLRPELAAVIGAERFLREIQTIADAAAPAHPRPDRQRRGERHRVLRHAVRRRRVAARPAAPREAAAGRRRGAPRHRGGRRPRLRPPARRDPPRHQAREHPAARRPRAGGRLRHRAGRLQRGRRRPDDRDRHVARHAALHVARAGHGRARHHRPLRRLRPRRRDLRDAGRRAAVHRAHGAGHRGQGDDAPTPPACRPSAGACRLPSRTRSSPRCPSCPPTASPAPPSSPPPSRATPRGPSPPAGPRPPARGPAPGSCRCSAPSPPSPWRRRSCWRSGWPAAPARRSPASRSTSPTCGSTSPASTASPSRSRATDPAWRSSPGPGRPSPGSRCGTAATSRPGCCPAPRAATPRSSRPTAGGSASSRVASCTRWRSPAARRCWWPTRPSSRCRAPSGSPTAGSCTPGRTSR